MLRWFGILCLSFGTTLFLRFRLSTMTLPNAFASRYATKRSIQGEKFALITMKHSEAIARSIKRVVSATPTIPDAEALNINTFMSCTTVNADRCLYVFIYSVLIDRRYQNDRAKK